MLRALVAELLDELPATVPPDPVSALDAVPRCASYSRALYQAAWEVQVSCSMPTRGSGVPCHIKSPPTMINKCAQMRAPARWTQQVCMCE